MMNKMFGRWQLAALSAGSAAWDGAMKPDHNPPAINANRANNVDTRRLFA
jgi:hypothetical protein